MENMNEIFPVMAWDWLPEDRDVIAEVAACGFTVAGFATPKALDLVYEAGMYAIVSDVRLSKHDWRQVDAPAVQAAVGEVVAEVGKHPAVFGYYIKDEPHAEEFAGLEVAAETVRRLAPGSWPYINLFPDYATPEQLGTASYAEHLEQFVATCHPTIISYDNYSLMEDEDVRMPYWTNLSSVRAAARKHGLPFWNIILSTAHFNYRVTTATDLRFQVYTSLAYGARGISYFKYLTPLVGNYRMGPIDQFGNKTATWYMVQHMNLQIQQLAPTLLKLTSDDVYHFGKVPTGEHSPTEQSLVVDPGAPQICAGDFTHEDGSRYVMLVNTDFHRSTWITPKFRTEPKRVLIVSPYLGTPVPFTGEQNVLAPGQGSLLKLEY